MLRFLVLQEIALQNDQGHIFMDEPVIDFASMTEAEKWISDQPDPKIYKVEDQFSDEDPDVDLHDFNYYEMRESSSYFGANEGYGSEVPDDEDDEIHDGDGDAD